MQRLQFLFAILIFFSASTATLMSRDTPLAVGESAPRVQAVNQNGETVNLDESFYQGLVLVYFYPKADTPGCTSQACSLRDAYEKLSQRGLRIVGVSTDSVEAQAAFSKKYQLPFQLLADPDGDIVRAFGVPSRIVGAQSFASRQAFLIKDNHVIWRDLSASTEQQAEDVLSVLANQH